MKIDKIAETEDLIHIAITGRMDTAGVDAGETQFNATLAPPGKHAVVDLAGVTDLTSMGIRMLIVMAKTLAKKGKKMTLLAPPRLVLESIRNVALDKIIPVSVDIDEAKKNLAL